MPARDESSVMFALRDLRRIETERTQEEEASAAARRRDEEARQAQAHQAQAQAQAQARRVAEEETRVRCDLAEALRRIDGLRGELAAMGAERERLRSRVLAPPPVDPPIARPAGGWSIAAGAALLLAAGSFAALALRPTVVREVRVAAAACPAPPAAPIAAVPPPVAAAAPIAAIEIPTRPRRPTRPATLPPPAGTSAGSLEQRLAECGDDPLCHLDGELSDGQRKR